MTCASHRSDSTGRRHDCVLPPNHNGTHGCGCVPQHRWVYGEPATKYPYSGRADMNQEWERYAATSRDALTLATEALAAIRGIARNEVEGDGTTRALLTAADELEAVIGILESGAGATAQTITERYKPSAECPYYGWAWCEEHGAFHIPRPTPSQSRVDSQAEAGWLVREYAELVRVADRCGHTSACRHFRAKHDAEMWLMDMVAAGLRRESEDATAPAPPLSPEAQAELNDLAEYVRTGGRRVHGEFHAWRGEGR